MPRSRELRGVVIPDVDDRAIRRNVERPLSRTMDRVGQITPTLNLSGLRDTVSGLFGGGGGTGGGGVGRDTVQVAQLDVLEDIHDTLRRQDGGGGGSGGLLTGLGLGSRLGGGGGLLGGLLGTAGTAIGGGLGLAAIFEGTKLFNDAEGLFSNDEISSVLGDSPMMGFPRHMARGFSSLLGISGDIGESLGLVESADEFERKLKEGLVSNANWFVERMRTGARFWTQDVPNAIRNIELPSLPSLSNLQLPGPVRRAVEVFDRISGGGETTTRTMDLSERASDQSLSFSERRSAQAAFGEQRRQGESDTVTVESPTLDISEVRIDGSDILNDLQQTVDQKLSELEGRIEALDEGIRGSGGF